MVALVAQIDVRRDTEFYRPQIDDLPQALQASLQQMLTDQSQQFDLEYTRVLGYRAPDTKNTIVLGLYSMMPVTDIHFELRKWRTMAEYEGQGFGRRLLGHALGLAESKGGRRVTICVPSDRVRAAGILQRYGFIADIVDMQPIAATGAKTNLVFEVLPE